MPDIQQVLDENSQFLIAQIMELGVTDGEAVRDMLMMDERKGMTTPMWALDHIHCAIEIFAHGFQNLVEELIKLALTHSKEKKKAEILELNNEGLAGDDFSYDMDMPGGPLRAPGLGPTGSVVIGSSERVASDVCGNI